MRERTHEHGGHSLDPDERGVQFGVDRLDVGQKELLVKELLVERHGEATVDEAAVEERLVCLVVAGCGVVGGG